MGTSSSVDGLSTDLIERSLLSFMGRFMYGYKGKYLLTLTGRWDGASQLSVDNKLHTQTVLTGSGKEYAKLNINRFFNGQIDDIRIYNYTLTNIQKTVLYTKELSFKNKEFDCRLSVRKKTNCSTQKTSFYRKCGALSFTRRKRT